MSRTVRARVLQWLTMALPWIVAPLLLFPRISLIWVAALVPAAWGLRYAVAGTRLPATPLNVLLVPLFGMVAVSLYATYDVGFSLGKVAGTLLGGFLFLAVVEVLAKPRRIHAGMAVFLTGGAALAVLSLFTTRWKTGVIPWLANAAAAFPARLRGLPGAEEGLNANPVGGTMLLFVFVAALIVFRGAGWARRLWPDSTALTRRPLRRGVTAGAGGTLLLTAGILLLSQARSAWFGAAAGSVLVVLALVPRARMPVLVGGPVLAIILSVSLASNAVSIVVDQPDTAAGEIGQAGRIEIWNRALYAIQDFPVTGMGMNVFRRAVHELYPLFLVPPNTDIANAHNSVLQSALDLGIPGMVAYLAIWVAAARMLVHVWMRSADGLHRLYAIGLGAGLLAQFVAQLVDAIPLGAKLGVFWWLALGLVAALFRTEVPNVAFSAWRRAEILLVWLLASLLAIAWAGEQPYVALTAAVAGAACMGFRAADTGWMDPGGGVACARGESGRSHVSIG